MITLVMRNLVIAAILIAIVIVGGIFFYAQPKKEAVTASPTQAQSQAPAMQDQTAQIVSLTKNGFSPAALTVKVGTRVRWVNNSGQMAALDSNPHPTHTSYPPLNFGNFSNGSSVELVFDKPGTYGYHNHLNPSQTGTVIVE